MISINSTTVNITFRTLWLVKIYIFIHIHLLAFNAGNRTKWRAFWTYTDENTLFLKVVFTCWVYTKAIILLGRICSTIYLHFKEKLIIIFYMFALLFFIDLFFFRSFVTLYIFQANKNSFPENVYKATLDYWPDFLIINHLVSVDSNSLWNDRVPRKVIVTYRVVKDHCYLKKCVFYYCIIRWKMPIRV